jgi:superfamily II DNA/RNA helicase
METNWHAQAGSLDEIGIHEKLLEGVFACGFDFRHTESLLSQYGIPPILQGHDMVVQCESGPHKSVTYAIGVLQNLDLSDCHCQALVLVPSTELASSMARLLQGQGGLMTPPVRVVSLAGNLAAQVERVDDLQQGFHAVVSTPGKIGLDWV